ncbi:LysR substrate-binding domain-containing protein [Polyangium sp. y55x31]|uniref:LysR substrate-binding domain-containing protein n=1 Tax=Polyangium sp. y55x31 TaxID=3042688 RepID=UPI002482DE08|nr:LysR substrate-binding domain-containing protein [Polyangium sp. y55x31]MDI1480481.1 LysR substrate-binding domain-containing protein [Polyangium sp. y55x31]
MRLAPHPVTLRQLQYVVAVADRKSFRKAADDCHVSQPSLSAQIQQAEEALGICLFERDRRTVTLTAAGAEIVARARALLVAADDLVDTARRFGDPFAGTLRLGVIPTIGPYLLPEIAPVLRERYPKLTFVWTEEKTSTLVQMLGQGALDGAIVALEADIGDRPHVVLGKDPFVFAAAPGHPLAGTRRPLKPEELEGECVLLLDDGHCFRDQALSFCSRAGAEEAGFRATSLATLTQMVAGGAGVTLLPSLAVPLENRRDALRIRPFAPRGPARTLALVWRRGSALESTLRPVGETLRSAYTTRTERGQAAV